MSLKRYLYNLIKEDLKERMVFIGGPRQVGKTTLAQTIGSLEYKNPLYLNWDNKDDRKDILDQRFPSNTDLIIFDEIHKYKPWKNYLKGIFDKHKKEFHILVTGSARLDLYRKGGDSLFGRYHYYRLHPFSVAELLNIKNDFKIFAKLNLTQRETNTSFNDLLKFGGFPETIIKKNQRTLRRWQNERLARLVKEDIRDLELIRDISSLEILTDILPSKVGSLFSINALREDLQVTHKTISHWTDVLERFYYHFRIYPFNFSPTKSLRKEPKLFLWDWSSIQDTSARLENIIAAHLLKFVNFLYDAEGHKAKLHFLRDKEGREVDLLVSVDNQPWLAVEVKQSHTKPSKHLLYFAGRLKIPYLFQVVNVPDIDFTQNNVRVISADRFLGGLV